mmetsp:Transcript_55803/g.155586  ORF Transcript_55803/g.155586 Transcript_55803/m.155586 type:complete len:243 (-) Transcript_55803:923-1651(-)
MDTRLQRLVLRQLALFVLVRRLVTEPCRRGAEALFHLEGIISAPLPFQLCDLPLAFVLHSANEGATRRVFLVQIPQLVGVRPAVADECRVGAVLLNLRLHTLLPFAHGPLALQAIRVHRELHYLTTLLMVVLLHDTELLVLLPNDCVSVAHALLEFRDLLVLLCELPLHLSQLPPQTDHLGIDLPRGRLEHCVLVARFGLHLGRQRADGARGFEEVEVHVPDLVPELDRLVLLSLDLGAEHT